MKDYEALLVALRQITRAIDLHSRQLLKETGLTTLAIADSGRDYSPGNGNPHQYCPRHPSIPGNSDQYRGAAGKERAGGATPLWQ